MKNEGFTLVELLAVILILAFIAIIAVPIVLNIITEAKIKSLKISTSEYIRAVNTSLINEEVFNNVSDGLYTITDDGKKIVLGDKEIFINYDGRGLKSGLLLIENSKVTRVLKGLIDDYYARVTDEDIEILKNLNESTLVSGQEFNKKVKELVGDTKDDGSTPDYNTVDTKVKKIIFLQDGILPDEYTKEDLLKLQSTDLSSKNDGSIKGYYDEVNQVIYVYSDGYISCPTSLSFLYNNFQGVQEIELNLIDTSSVTNMWCMFQNCKSLKNVNLMNLNTSKVTTMESMFAGCSLLEIVNIIGLNTFRVTKMGGYYGGGMFQNCTNLKEINGIETLDTSNVTETEWMFYGCSSLTSLDLSKWVTSKVLNMSRMLQNCSSLKSIKFGKNFDTSSVNNMSSMFLGCSSLEELDLASFDTSKVTSMRDMFASCTNLTSIKFGKNFDTSSVVDMYHMFLWCQSLKELDLSNWDTSKVENMESMFEGLKNAKTIKFGEKFTTTSVNSVGNMFKDCNSLEELDLSSFDISSVTIYRGIFSGCTNLKVVKVTKDKWTLDTSLLNGTQTQNYTYVN